MASELDTVGSLRRSWWLLVLCALIGGDLLGIYYYVSPPKYTASADVLYSHDDPTQALTGQSSGFGSGDPERALSTQKDIVQSDAVVSAVSTKLGIGRQAVVDALTVTSATGSDTLTIAAQERSPARARDLAAATVAAYTANDKTLGVRRLRSQAQALTPLIDQLRKQLTPRPRAGDLSAIAAANAVQAQLSSLQQKQQGLLAAAASYNGQVSVLSQPEKPTRPSSPSWQRGAAEGTVAGLAVGALLALFRGAGRPREPRQRGVEQRAARTGRRVPALAADRTEVAAGVGSGSVPRAAARPDGPGHAA